jgi:hypothetical protein
LGRAEAVRLAQSYVGAYNDRDLEAMLALQGENVVSYPVRSLGIDRSPAMRACGRGGRRWRRELFAAHRLAIPASMAVPTRVVVAAVWPGRGVGESGHGAHDGDRLRVLGCDHELRVAGPVPEESAG